MDSERERRHQPRIRYSWPLWFGYEENGELFPAQVIDLSLKGVSFKCDQHYYPQVGHHLLTRFSFPCDPTDGFEMDSYFHWAEVVRVEDALHGKRRVAMRLHQNLPAEPAQSASVLAATAF